MDPEVECGVAREEGANSKKQGRHSHRDTDGKCRCSEIRHGPRKRFGGAEERNAGSIPIVVKKRVIHDRPVDPIQINADQKRPGQDGSHMEIIEEDPKWQEDGLDIGEEMWRQSVTRYYAEKKHDRR